MLMLQALLEDRFHLQVHRETKEMAVYLLVVANGGLKMQSADAPNPTPFPKAPPGPHSVQYRGHALPSLKSRRACLVRQAPGARPDRDTGDVSTRLWYTFVPTTRNRRDPICSRRCGSNWGCGWKPGGPRWICWLSIRRTRSLRKTSEKVQCDAHTGICGVFLASGRQPSLAVHFCGAVAWLLTLALRKNRAAVRYWLWENGDSNQLPNSGVGMIWTVVKSVGTSADAAR